MTTWGTSYLGDAVTLNTVALYKWPFLIENSFEVTRGAPKNRQNSRDEEGPYGRRSARGPRTFDLIVNVFGEIDAATGDPNPDIRTGVEVNVEWLQSMTLDAAEDEFGCIPISCVRRSGLVLAGGIQIDDFVPAPGKRGRKVFMKATLPTGRLDVVEDP